MCDSYKAKGTTAPFLQGDILNPRNAPPRIADPEITAKSKAAAGPHSSRQRNGRKKSAFFRMSISSKFSRRRERLSQAKMKQVRHRVSMLRQTAFKV